MVAEPETSRWISTSRAAALLFASVSTARQRVVPPGSAASRVTDPAITGRSRSVNR